MFHDNMKKAMVERGISQTQLALMTGLSISGISQYLHGLVIPRNDALERISEVLGVSAQHLIYGQSTEPQVDSSGLEKIKTITPEHIAKISGRCVQSIRVALQQGKPDYGYAIKVTGNRYAYHFYPRKVEECYGSLTGYGYFLEGYHREQVKD